VDQAGGDRVGVPPGGGHGGVTRAEVVGQAGADAGGDGAAAAGEDGADEQEDEPRGRPGPRAAAREEKTLHEAGSGCDNAIGRVRSGGVVGVRTAILPDGPAVVHLTPVDQADGSKTSRKVQIPT
jgi:hypothetical protein